VVLSARGVRCTILSTDKDMCLLASETTVVRNHFTGEIRDPAWVLAEFGVDVSQLLDVMALMGDTADNVPGVAGIGKIYASGLIRRFGTLEHLIANADQVKGKLGERLRAQADMAILSKQLIALKTDLNLGVQFSTLRCQQL